LTLERELADLVDEQRAAVGSGEEPWPPLQRAREGPALMAEQLAREEVARQGRAVERT
jgi:hypothetical protein